MAEPTGRKIFMRAVLLICFLIILTGIVLFITYGSYGDKQTLGATMLPDSVITESAISG